MILKRISPLLILSIVLMGMKGKAESSADSLVQTLSVVEDGYHRIDLYLQISTSFKGRNIDSALHYAESARMLALDEENDKGVAESLLILGKINLRRDSSYAAREKFFEALEFTEECECDSVISALYLFIGKTYALHDNYSEAIIYFLKSLEIAERTDKNAILADLFDDIGLVMILLEDYDQATAYFNRSLAINEQVGDQKNYANTLRNIGLIYQRKKQYNEAEKQYLKALEIYEKMQYYPGLSTSNIGIGNTELGMGNYQTALSYYLIALDYAKKKDITTKENRPLFLTLCYNRLGETYLKLGRYEDALDALRNASDLSEQFNLPSREADAAQITSQVYEKTGNISLSFEYYKLYNKLSDSIINARNVSFITKLQLEYQFLKEQKEREIENALKEEAFKRKVLMYQSIGAFSFVSLILLLVILILYRKNERSKRKQSELNQKNLELKKENLTKELEYKNKKLTTNVMYQLRKNNFIRTISEKLKSILLTLKAENKKVIQEVVKELESNMTRDSWEEFEYRFNDVHTNFYDNLIKDFPDLTPNELRLSAFLKLNMTTKDIATITYQTPHSITVARHRLRTKLGLDRDDNLVSFLSRY